MTQAMITFIKVEAYYYYPYLEWPVDFLQSGIETFLSQPGIELTTFDLIVLSQMPMTLLPG